MRHTVSKVLTGQFDDCDARNWARKRRGGVRRGGAPDVIVVE